MTGSTTPELIDELRRALAGRYHVERLLGAGGMGSVYLGRDVTLDRPVAIKVIAPELAAARSIRERFLREARTVARLRHPSIVAVYAAGESDGMLYFVMEYVAGESLRAVLDRDGRFDDGRAVVALRDLARALAYAHENGVVHRDVKPENVLLDADTGRAMLTDFGVAALVNRGGDPGATPDDGRTSRMTGTGFVLGSPRYMSPEQAAGERELDGRSDVYSLGLVGYEMFAGEPAISATSAATMLVKQLTETPPPIETRSDRVPPAVAEAIMRALEKEPDRRWATAAEMADVIDGAAAGAGGDAYRGGPPRDNLASRALRGATGSRPAGSNRRVPGRGALLAGLAVLLVGGGAGAWYAASGRGGVPRGVDPRKSFLVAPFEVLAPDPQLAWLREGSVSMLSTNLAQWTDLSVVDYERSLDLMREADVDRAARISLEDARRMARRAGVWTVVTGQVTSPGDSVVVVARLFDVASGRKLNEAQQSVARQADPRALYDALARELLDLAGAPRNVTLARLAETTTPSLAAYRAYLEGVRALNNWRLARADSLFDEAIRQDSTFALAYYRRAVTLGWRASGSPDQVAAITRATQLANRLPPRERDMVSAYADLTAALRAQGSVEADTARTNALFTAAQRKYDAVVARDSGDAEAWFGLGDAYWHHQVDGWGSPGTVANWTRALHAFNRTLALDSTFYLAYSHKLDVYANASGQIPGLVLDGDSLRLLPTDAARQAFGAERVRQAQQAAHRLAVREGRAWIAADPSPYGYEKLAYLYLAVGQPDSATAVLREAMQNPATRAARMPFFLAALQLPDDPPAALRSLREALRTADARRLRAEGGSDLFDILLKAGGAAAASGRIDEVNQVASLTADVIPHLPGTKYPLAPITGWWATGSQLAMGVPFASVRARLDSGLAAIDRTPEPVARLARGQSVAVPYLAYLATRDGKYLAAVRRWRAGAQQPWEELDALEALAANDTNRARQIVTRFPSVDSLKAVGAGMNVMRWVARAEAREGLGDLRGAVGTYEALDPRRFGGGRLDPTWALYTRSFLARGRVYEQLGERDKAADAYTRFLELWKEADPVLQPQLREAREGLGRVRDVARSLPAR